MVNTGTAIEVVLFDVGGVLLTNGWDHIERAAVLAHFNFSEQEIARFEARHPSPYDSWERDEITAEDYLNATIFCEPRSFSLDEFITAMKLESKPLPDNALGILGEVAASGRWMVGLLNNESRLLHEYRIKKYELENHIDLQLSSCYLGLRKPESAIYRRAIDILGRPADRVLFIDDRAGNTAAAKAAGMNAIQFLGEEPLRASLQELGIL